MRNLIVLLTLLAVSVSSVGAEASELTLVVCAPGYPGRTETAQPVMNDFAEEVSRGVAEAALHVSAVYHPTAEGGLKSLAESEAGLAIVGVPFYLKYQQMLDLQPVLAVEPKAGARERWSLVARKGAVTAPSSLSGWRVVGIAGFAPEFVRSVALAEWGELPEDVSIEFSSRMVSELRRAAKGENTAVLLDSAQTEALPSLPFANDLEVITRSEAHLGSLLCTVGGRLNPDEIGAISKALVGMHLTERGREALDAIRTTRFVDVDLKELASLRQAFSLDSR